VEAARLAAEAAAKEHERQTRLALRRCRNKGIEEADCPMPEAPVPPETVPLTDGTEVPLTLPAGGTAG